MRVWISVTGLRLIIIASLTAVTDNIDLENVENANKTHSVDPEAAELNDNCTVNNIIRFNHSEKDNHDTSITQFGIALSGYLELTTAMPGPLYPDFAIMEKKVVDAANTAQFQVFKPGFVLICILLTFGIPGNIVALTVYIKLLKKAIARQFIITLASSDLITCLVAMPIELDIMTHFFTYDYPVLCKSFRFTAYFVNNISSITLVIIAVERYQMICNPWKQKFTAQFSRAICFANVAFSALTSVPMVFMYGIQTIVLNKIIIKETNVTERNAIMFESPNVTQENKVVQEYYTTYGKSCLLDDKMVDSAFPFYVIGVYIFATVILFVMLTYLYGHIVACLARRRKESLTKKEQTQRSATHRVRSVTLMAITLAVLYVICYLPCLIIVCLRLARPQLYNTLTIGGKTTYQIFLKLYLVNSALNPFIYCFYNRDVRRRLCSWFTSKSYIKAVVTEDNCASINNETVSRTAVSNARTQV